MLLILYIALLYEVESDQRVTWMTKGSDLDYFDCGIDDAATDVCIDLRSSAFRVITGVDDVTSDGTERLAAVVGVSAVGSGWPIATASRGESSALAECRHPHTGASALRGRKKVLTNSQIKHSGP